MQGLPIASPRQPRSLVLSKRPVYSTSVLILPATYIPLFPIAFSAVDLCMYHFFSYDWSGQMFVTGSNDGHVFVCDARVSNNFKVLGHLGQNWSIVVTF